MKTKSYNPFFLAKILLLYVVISLFFHKPLWKETVRDSSKENAVYGEAVATEWGQEKLYRNLMTGKNPFTPVKEILYPFGGNLVTTDSGNGFFFPFLRPFLSAHQSTIIIWLTEIIAANLGMFLLLYALGNSIAVSFLIGLAYGYMTFLMPRIGHFTYFSIYVFPWFYLSIVKMFSKVDKNRISNFIGSIGAAVFLVLSLYLNLYYFVILAVSIALFLAYMAVFSRQKMIQAARAGLVPLCLSLALTLAFISPWLFQVYDTYMFDQLPASDGWGGAIQFSADVFGYLIPSSYSYFLGRYSELIGLRFPFASSMFENFSYPGIIIILTYATILALSLRKKIRKYLFPVLPYLFVSFCFFVLTLGPFLHVFGKWGITLDDGIRVVFPLPYVIFHEIPFLDNVRSPARLVVGFIFFSYLISAYLINIFMKNKSKAMRIIFFVVLGAVIIIDHYFKYSVSPLPRFIPVKAYAKISEDRRPITVMESPSSVRDGFTYFGDQSSLDFFVGQEIHKKPIIGGYFGRIPNYKKDYYVNNPWLGYVGRLTDENLKDNGSFDRSDLEKWQEPDLKKSTDSLDFLDIGYYLLDGEKPYSATLSADLKDLGFESVMKDGPYSLWKRQVNYREFLNAAIGGTDEMYLGMGWNQKEPGGRWAWDKSSVLFKVTKERRFVLNFTARSFLDDNPTDIYIDKKKIGKVTLTDRAKAYTLPIDFSLKPGLHTVYFLFSRSDRPSDVSTSLDPRKLSAKFTNVSLSEIK